MCLAQTVFKDISGQGNGQAQAQRPPLDKRTFIIGMSKAILARSAARSGPQPVGGNGPSAGALGGGSGVLGG